MLFSSQVTGMQKQEVKRYLEYLQGKFGLGVQSKSKAKATRVLLRMRCSWQAPSSNNPRDNSTHGHHQMVNTRNHIDHILCSQRWRRSIKSIKTRQGADCGSDHKLLIAKFRLKLKKVGETTSTFRYEINQIP